MTINEIAEKVHVLAREKGWYDKEEDENQYIERICNNLHDEISELHESWRSCNLHLPCDKSADMITAGIEPITCLEEELADIIIRVLDSAQYFGIDIQKVILAKHEYNTGRTYRHGGKRS